VMYEYGQRGRCHYPKERPGGQECRGEHEGGDQDRQRVGECESFRRVSEMEPCGISVEVTEQCTFLSVSRLQNRVPIKIFAILSKARPWCTSHE
jgi:hypothetical protein